MTLAATATEPAASDFVANGRESLAALAMTAALAESSA